MSKERRCQAYHTTSLPRHHDLTANKLCYCFASITAMFFPLTIVMYKGKFEQQVHKVWMLERGAKLWTISVMQLEAIYIWLQINTSAIVKKGNGIQRRTKVSSWCTHCSYFEWQKGTFWVKAMSNGEKWASSVCHWVTLVWRHQAVCQLVSLVS